MSQPNIIYILADDMGYGDMERYNPESKIPTPNLNRLSDEGIRFTDAHATSAVCTPSRYSILTGRYCWRSPLKRGVLWQYDARLIEQQRPTIASHLKSNGYKTAAFGKWHLGLDWQTNDGQPTSNYIDAGTFDQSKRFELGKNIDFSKPFGGGPVDCGFDNYFGIDVPNMPPYTWFENDKVTIPPTETHDYKANGEGYYPNNIYGVPGPKAPDWNQQAETPEFTQRIVDYIDSSGETPFFIYYAMTGPHTPLVPIEECKGKSGAGRYGDFVSTMDWSVGKILDALDKKGIADNTLVIFTSDNGPEAGKDGYPVAAYERIQEYDHCSMGALRGTKRDLWEGGHRVPFLLRWPAKTPANATCDQLVSLADLFATCADITQSELPEGAAEDSLSMLSLIEDPAAPAYRDEMVLHSCTGKFALRNGDRVYINSPTGEDMFCAPARRAL